MGLKTRTTISQNVNYDDLEQFVKEKTGREWSFVAAGEYDNGEQHTFVLKGGPLDKWDTKSMQEFITSGTGYPHPHTMMNWLAEQKHIVPGRYVIDINW